MGMFVIVGRMKTLAELVYFFPNAADLDRATAALLALAKKDAPSFQRQDLAIDVDRGDGLQPFQSVRLFSGYSALRWTGVDRGELFALAATLHGTERGTIQIR